MTQDALADLLALADDDTHGPWMTAERKVIAALVRVAMATSVVMDYGTVREYPALAQELGALDAALAKGKP